jgi:hypothetical protein
MGRSGYVSKSAVKIYIPCIHYLEECGQMKGGIKGRCSVVYFHAVHFLYSALFIGFSKTSVEI